MKLLNSQQMREMDRTTIDVLGVPSTLLMTNAAEHVAKAALGYAGEGGSAAVFCGSGNNGGDGVAAAAYLIKKGVSVRTFLTGSREKMTADTAEMERRLNELGGVLEDFGDALDAEYYVNHCDVIIDAMFGIGLNSNLRGTSLEAVRLINASPARVVAADIPSGVEADTGSILGDAVRADATVTFAHAKIGHYNEPGCIYCGDVRVVDIGIPRELIENVPIDCHAVVPGDITLPRRRRDTHKGDYGRALVVAGSVGYTGAPFWPRRAASCVGAGLVSLGVPEAVYAIAAGKCDEEMCVPACRARARAGLPTRRSGHSRAAGGLRRLSHRNPVSADRRRGQDRACVIRQSAVRSFWMPDGINAVGWDYRYTWTRPDVPHPHAATRRVQTARRRMSRDA
jgi:NAD(P)H-hydrate epimerase